MRHSTWPATRANHFAPWLALKLYLPFPPFDPIWVEVAGEDLLLQRLMKEWIETAMERPMVKGLLLLTRC